MENEEKIEKSDESILFPEEKIGDLVVKPWSFGMLFEISPYLEIVVDKAEESGLIKKFEENTTFLSYPTMIKLFTIASKPMLMIIAMTVGKDEDYIKSLDMETGMKLAVTIYNQNKSTISNSLKNVFSPPKEKGKRGGQK